MSECVVVRICRLAVRRSGAQGASRLFFLDYFRNRQLETEQAFARISRVIAKCCEGRAVCLDRRRKRCPSAGDVVEGDFDLAGSSVGAMNGALDLPRDVAAGDVFGWVLASDRGAFQTAIRWAQTGLKNVGPEAGGFFWGPGIFGARFLGGAGGPEPGGAKPPFWGGMVL